MNATGKFIGGGLQHRVFRISATRVRKVPTTRAQKIALIKTWSPRDAKEIWRLVRQAEHITKYDLPKIRKIAEGRNLALLGHPKFLSNLRYEQDYAVKLESYFAQHGLVQNKRMIDKYIESIIAAWRLGFSDMVFNFTKNNGVLKNQAVFIDLGEFVLEKARVQELIREKKWLKQWSYTHLEDQRLKKYFARQMKKKLTLQRLEREWGSRS